MWVLFCSTAFTRFFLADCFIVYPDNPTLKSECAIIFLWADL